MFMLTSCKRYSSSETTQKRSTFFGYGKKNGRRSHANTSEKFEETMRNVQRFISKFRTLLLLVLYRLYTIKYLNVPYFVFFECFLEYM